MRESVKGFMTVMYVFINMGQWIFFFILLNSAWNNEGMVHLHFNMYGELLLETIIFSIVFVFLTITSIIKLREL